MMIDQQSEREPVPLKAQRKELVERIARAVREDGTVQPLEGMYLTRSSSLTEPLPGVFEPSVCVIAQGSKQILFGDSRYQYDPLHYLLVTMELPHISHVLEASKEQPYFSLRLSLPPSLVSSVMLESSQASPRDHAGVRAIDVSPVDGNLLNAFVRLLGLLDAPTEVPFLQPLIIREIIYRLLMGEQGNRLRHLAIVGGHTSSIARAVERLRQNFDQPLHVEKLARELGMSVSGFHHHFKTVTAMSPTQFQKRMRLQEARRLMLSEDLDAASVAYRVGYNDASHFNREYKSLFGAPPLRDVQRLRDEALQNAE
ncbi:AraC family transcriptional regulator [Dictyobacter sp. S3.2.2.5]|uniref:AraC family transcriptional regulator n=2 Tax=Dictyobacter halimunensis TaxID=3026934 RepID=A0ABQ6FKM8_9CHLR|nr:AraC family transcriptional regulator [Dictyobacter sp. S3.2.2.5]